MCYILLHTRVTIPGVRFARALRLMQVPDILQYLQVLRTGRQIRFAQLISNFLSVCLTGAGVIHLVSTLFAALLGVLRMHFDHKASLEIQNTFLWTHLLLDLVFIKCAFLLC